MHDTVSKLGNVYLVFVKPRTEIDGDYYRDGLLVGARATMSRRRGRPVIDGGHAVQ